MFTAGDGKIDARVTDGYLTPNDIAELLDVPYWKVHGWIKKGKIETDSDHYCGSRQRIRIEPEDFKEFLRENPEHYATIYGEPPTVEIEYNAEPIEEPVTLQDEDMNVLDVLFGKLEEIEAKIDEHKMEIDKLETKKLALTEVIDML